MKIILETLFYLLLTWLLGCSAPGCVRGGAPFWHLPSPSAPRSEGRRGSACVGGGLWGACRWRCRRRRVGRLRRFWEIPAPLPWSLCSQTQPASQIHLLKERKTRMKDNADPKEGFLPSITKPSSSLNGRIGSTSIKFLPTRHSPLYVTLAILWGGNYFSCFQKVVVRATESHRNSAGCRIIKYFLYHFLFWNVQIGTFMEKGSQGVRYVSECWISCGVIFLKITDRWLNQFLFLTPVAKPDIAGKNSPAAPETIIIIKKKKTSVKQMTGLLKLKTYFLISLGVLWCIWHGIPIG